MSSRILQFQVGGNSTAVLGIEVDDLLEAGIGRPARGLWIKHGKPSKQR